MAPVDMVNATRVYQAPAETTTLTSRPRVNHAGAPGGTSNANRLLNNASAFGFDRFVTSPRRNAREVEVGVIAVAWSDPPCQAALSRRQPRYARYVAPASLMRIPSPAKASISVCRPNRLELAHAAMPTVTPAATPSPLRREPVT